MSKNTAKIREGFAALSEKSPEIISGTVVPGSIDTGALTCRVQPTDNSAPIEGVMLNAVAENSNGLILFPKDNSNVIIGCVDGPGEWTLLRASEIDKAQITIGPVLCEIDANRVEFKNGSVVLDIGAAVFKMNTAGESLYQLLKDLVTGISVLEVVTAGVTSSVPTNAATFTSLLTRLNNLLSA